ncbi:MAG: hypothetical protein ACFCVE_04895 [Phycisphaerae bacterium]
MRFAPSLLLSLFVLLLVGCEAQPRSFDENKLGEEAVLRARASDFWEVSRLRTIGRADVKRVAITEFNIAFVTYKSEGGLPQQAAVTNPIPTGFIGLGFNSVGLDRRAINYDAERAQAFTDLMYQALVDLLEERGVEVVPMDKVTASESYARFSGRTAVENVGAMFFNPFGTDVGRRLAKRTQAATGLMMIQDSTLPTIPLNEFELIREIGVDASIRCTFYVGLFRGRATIEEESTISFAGEKVLANLVSKRSVLSDAEVVTGSDFFPGRGSAVVVDADAFLAAQKRMFEPYVMMAVYRLQSELGVVLGDEDPTTQPTVVTPAEE